MRLVREANARRILARHPCSGKDGLALREKEGVVAFDPKQRTGVGRAFIVDADLLAVGVYRKAERLPDVLFCGTHLEINGLSVYANRLDVEVSAIENDAFGIVGSFDVVGGRSRDHTRVKIDSGIPIEVRDNGFFWPAVAVVIGGSFHVKDGLGFGGVGVGRRSTSSEASGQRTQRSNEE